MSIEVNLWNEGEELSVDVLRNQYSPPNKYRVSEYRYQSGEYVPGVHRSGKLFIIDGLCRFKANGSHAILKKGTYLEFPSGDYSFDVIGNTELHLVLVWDLEKIFNESSSEEKGT